jgi:hypothetical protein
MCYTVDHQLPSLFDLLNASLITDFQTISRPSSVDYSLYSSKIFTVYNILMSILRVLVLYGMLMYSTEQNTVSNKTSYTSNYIESPVSECS